MGNTSGGCHTPGRPDRYRDFRRRKDRKHRPDLSGLKKAPAVKAEAAFSDVRQEKAVFLCLLFHAGEIVLQVCPAEIFLSAYSKNLPFVCMTEEHWVVVAKDSLLLDISTD